MLNRSAFAALCAVSAFIAFTATAPRAQNMDIKGTLLTMTGDPIKGATCRFRNAGNKAVTDDKGAFTITGPLGTLRPDGYAMAMTARGRELTVTLDEAGRAAIDLFDMSGRLIRSVAARELTAGTHRMEFAPLQGARALYLLRVRIGTGESWHRLTVQDGAMTLTGAQAATLVRANAKTGAAPDSLFCAMPGYHGGHAAINGRAITAYTGTFNLRMFSSDKAWDVCAPPQTFAFDQSAGALYFQKLIPDPTANEQEVLREVCQSIWKTAAEVPANKRFTTYKSNINAQVTTGVASTGGNSLNFNVGYINGLKGRGDYAAWYEVLGVLVHEATHSYQPYYSTAGADGFGEAVPDAIRALTGFFKWPTGNKCSGSFTEAYQTGGKYWYFIEQKHPGFISKVYKLTAGDISARVQTVTGESLSSMVSECQSKGMP
jgi:hypothetical protein